jgi:gas vesicle protein
VPDELVHLVEQRAQTTTDWAVALKNSQEEHAQTIAKAKKDQDGIFEWAKEKQDELLEWGKEQHGKGLEAGKSMAEQVLSDMGQIVSERNQTIAELNEKIAELQANTDRPPVVAKDVLNPKSRLSLLKLVLGMAIDGYGFDPRESKSPFAKETVDRLAALGITIDEDTVRRWLREAAEEVTHTSPIKSE